ncbi:MAG: S9 family peptidase [Gemmatimonadales bacterium]|nr:MAG: S9 family peptidase [Gemmatimonadales bacterium]
MTRSRSSAARPAVRLLVSLLFLGLLAAPAHAHADPDETRGVVPAHYYQMTFVGDVALSPAGDRVAFTVTTVSEEENGRNRRIWLVEVEEGRPVGEPIPLTDPTRDSSSPRWSPDGRLLSFQSRRDGESSTWFLRTDGPGGEAFRIPGVEAAPIWSPDGAWIAYVTRPESEERQGPRPGWIAPDAITETADAERFDGRVITHSRYKSDGTLPLLPHPDAQPRSQLFVVEASGGEARQITDVAFDVGGPVWSPDGRRIVFTGNELAHTDPYSRLSDLYMVARDGGEVRRLTPGEGVHSAPAFAPDGSHLAFLRTREPADPTELVVVPVRADGTPGDVEEVVADSRELALGAPRFTPDGDRIRFETAHHGNRHIYEITLGGAGGSGSTSPAAAPVAVTRGDRQLQNVSESHDGAWMAYVSTDAVQPGEVFVAAGDGSGEVRLTDFNDAWMDGLILNAPERITWTVGDGTEVEGWVIAPVEADGARPGPASRPMVLKIHGGPHAMYGNTFFQTFHVLSAAGFYVFYPNPRGSSGYGHDFMYSTRGEWGLVDEEDFLTGVDAVLERYPEIDPARLGVGGGSYGGYATNWLTARSDRFAAAVTSRSIVSLETLHGTSDALGTLEFEFFGTPWEERERYRAASPWSYVENVTAPTLIIHSEYDHRTPMQDGEMWFRALDILGVPVEFVRYPRSSHGLSRTGEPWLLVDRLTRLRSWFVHWLEPEGGPAVDG